MAHAMACPYAEGRLRYGRARLAAHLGQTSTASEELDAARAIFRRLGARPYLQRAERLAAPLTPIEVVEELLPSGC